MYVYATIVYLSSIYIVTCQPDRVTCVTEVRNNIRSQPFLYACMHAYVCMYLYVYPYANFYPVYILFSTKWSAR